MPRIAFVTFGILRESYGHVQVQGFFDRGGAIFAAADADAGLIDRYLGSQGDYRTPAADNRFGSYCTGRFVSQAFAGREEQTLSLWIDLESVFAFAYSSNHAEALRGRRSWFLPPEWPSYVAWWVADDHRPDWPEANARLEHLHDHGPRSVSFDFRTPFDAAGLPTALDRTRIAALRGR